MEVMTMTEVEQVSGGIVDDIVGGPLSRGTNGSGSGGGAGKNGGNLFWLYYCFGC
jgi:hypothetical protein